MYEFATYFREWNVEQEGGLIYRMDYNQFWTWKEFNRLSTFTSEREDWRHAQLLSMTHNNNVTKESHLKSAKDFMPRTIDQIIEEEILEERKKEQNTTDSYTAEVHNFNSYVQNLKASGRPVQTITVK
jgi:hypothetical protein